VTHSPNQTRQNAEIVRLSGALWQIAHDGGYRLSGYGAGSVAKEALGKQWDKKDKKKVKA